MIFCFAFAFARTNEEETERLCKNVSEEQSD